ncbi:hypothetical protein BDU57DRAFT_518043 [Ampelomyces quisqualis]|uniref:F-box domain-containing protein n=1 Tax=Ampelomyces quisqualis TaxID=50730 RepID=A0A6A5QIG8_AMPQU|nr:hypothetical protein BDU57DRAFT_518043 [Ampelomyces quisqualis]
MSSLSHGPPAMAAQNKYQEDDEADEYDTESHDTDASYEIDDENFIQSIPPEILQTVFRKLKFFDLMHCQQVCKHWAAYLPGNDPALKELLFAAAKNVIVSKPKRTLQVFLRPEWQAYTIPVENDVPKLSFNLAFNKNMAYNTAPKHAVFHPMLISFYHKMHLVNSDFRIPDSWGKLQRRGVTPWPTFVSLRDLDDQVAEYQYNDGSWKDQLLCVPAVDRVAVHITWWKAYYTDDGLDVVRKVFTNKVATGVTMGEFVRVVRKLMEVWTVKDLKKFSEHLRINECDDCGRPYNADGYDDPQDSTSESESDVESVDSDGSAEQTSKIKFREFE